jgi:sugar/nucleoside kinase (ribokinase family)
MSSIQVVGHVCVDLTPSLGSTGVAAPGELAVVGPMGITIGGAVGNSARALAGLGVDVSLSASVGDDELGALCLRILQGYPGAVVDLTVVPGLATSYSVVVQPQGVDRSFWHHTGANSKFLGDCAVTAQQLIHYGYPSLTPAMCADDGAPIDRLFQRAHQQGVATSLDLAFVAANSPVRTVDWSALLEAVLPDSDVFCPSWDDLVSCLGVPVDADRECVGAWAETFVEWGAGVVLITLGERGSFLRVAPAGRLGALAACGIEPDAWAGTKLWMAADKLDHVVTTNGAGDTYKAAFLARLVQGADPRQCLEFAREVVARHLSGRALRD